MIADDRDGLAAALRRARTCRACFHQMDPWLSPTGRTAWRCLHCGRFEI